jgi:O-antigen ligase
MTDGLRRNVWLLIGLVLSALLLAGSRSLTAQVVFVASVLLLVTIGPFVRVLVDHAVWLGLLLAPLLLLAVTSLSVDDLFEWLSLAGKDATMSSRLPLWQLLQPFLADRFWLGHGYEAFWGEGHHALRVIEAKLYFKPHYAHNGYIELWLGLGAAGFALTAAVFIAFAVRAVRRLYADQRDPAWLLALVYVPMFLIQNIAEATILQRNSMNWVLFVWLALVLAIAARQRRAPQADASDPSDRALVSARRRPLAVH